MRLIDADALIDDLKHDVAIDQDSLDYEELTDSNREIIQFDKDCKQNAIDLLKNAPTADVRENVRGEWEVIDFEEPRRYGCTKCKMLCFYPYNFCPNCGADMRASKC